MKDSINNIQSEILKTATGLSRKNQEAVLSYAKRLKSTRKKISRNTGTNKIKKDLKTLSDINILHLEQEFKDYKKLYPREK